MKFRIIFSLLAIVVAVGSYVLFHGASDNTPQPAAQAQSQPSQAAPDNSSNSMSSFKIDNK